MIRLVGEVAAMRGGMIEKRRKLMNGLLKLLGADRWWWSVANPNGPDGRPSYTAVSHGGFEDGLFAKLLAAVEFPGSWHVFTYFARELEETKVHMTRTRRQMDFDGRFESPETKRMWNEAGVGDLLLSVCPLETGDYSAVGIYRSSDSRPFDPREAHITHLLMTELTWLHALGWTEDQNETLPKLSPRRRTVLNLVLEGQSRKEMAAALKISVHTLDGYVKDIFRHFGVHSQAELIASFRTGEGAVTPGSGD
ncbi:helix-turn-helix transcriptional regulator [Luteolibacter marinus]|uniref:helix-turn-helix transcriptional regulator n=1 Tax=Luteolibacter marinus TaxID=2776705 RepID=UPI001866AEB7|nr:helix-turn-helix transcriptional regulator [Luteolibacter marinus]